MVKLNSECVWSTQIISIHKGLDWLIKNACHCDNVCSLHLALQLTKKVYTTESTKWVLKNSNFRIDSSQLYLHMHTLMKMYIHGHEINKDDMSFKMKFFPSEERKQVKILQDWLLEFKTNTVHVSCNKTNKMSVRPAKTQISLGICPVWSESSLSAWRNCGSLATHWAHSKDSDQTGQMPRLIAVFAGRTATLLVLSCCIKVGLRCLKINAKSWFNSFYFSTFSNWWSHLD